MEVKDIVNDLLVGVWFDILYVGYKLSPNVVPKVGGDAVDDEAVVLGKGEVGLHLPEEERLELHFLMKIELYLLFSDFSNFVIIFFLVAVHPNVLL